MSVQAPALAARAPGRVGSWWRSATLEQRRVLLAAKLGWMLDAMDFVVYAMAIGALQTYFGFDAATAGLLGSVTLLVSAAGGLIFGVAADRIGRARSLRITILIFSFASLGAATSRSVTQLLLWRALLGIGMGGEWASGAVLVSETWPARDRTKAIGVMQSGWAIGYILAALLSVLFLNVLPLGPDAWRWLFAAGVLPALFTLWIRRSVAEPAAWRRAPARERRPIAAIFSGPLRTRTLLAIALAGAVQFAYWGLFFWLPGFLATPIDKGGAGMSLVRSVPWIVLVQLGAYAGYLSFGFFADRFGRRRTCAAFLTAAAILVPLFGAFVRTPLVLMVLGPLLGFVGHGYFSLFGSFLAELFPTAVRATGQGLTYNVGRGLGALAPFTIGALATRPRVGIGSALGLTSAFFLLGAALLYTLPDTSGRELDA